MAVKSMTGFGRAEGATSSMTWTWEVRSVNGRSLDVRMRLPPGYDALEPKVRERVGALFARGSVNLTLAVSRTVTGGELRINREAMLAVAEAVRMMRAAIPGETQVNIDGLLALRGVIDVAEPTETEADAEARSAAMLASLDTALQDLATGRAAEGRRLEAVLVAQINEVEALVDLVSRSPSRTAEAIGARLREQVERLTGQPGLDAARLHQEAMLIATRIDVDEELKRLTAHVAAARDLIRAKEPIGRKFDFLTQEFNREANTLCSKANDADITRAGLALKAVIDQMREQVQNIE